VCIGIIVEEKGVVRGVCETEGRASGTGKKEGAGEGDTEDRQRCGVALREWRLTHCGLEGEKRLRLWRPACGSAWFVPVFSAILTLQLPY